MVRLWIDLLGCVWIGAVVGSNPFILMGKIMLRYSGALFEKKPASYLEIRYAVAGQTHLLYDYLTKQLGCKKQHELYSPLYAPSEKVFSFLNHLQQLEWPVEEREAMYKDGSMYPAEWWNTWLLMHRGDRCHITQLLLEKQIVLLVDSQGGPADRIQNR